MSVLAEPHVAVVTGAGRGIGEAVARAMAAAGARVSVLDIDRESAQRVAQAITENGGHAIAVHADVGRLDDVASAFHRCADEWGRLDTLVNNAAVMPHDVRSLVETDPRDWDRVLETNLRGPFLCIRAGADLLRQSGGGSILNITSIGGRLGYPGRGSYGPSKAALESLTLQAAAELGPWNIRVNSISPGWFKTEMTAYAYSQPDEAERRRATVPMQRIGIPEDVANIAVFLSSPSAQYISGACLEVDGGLLAAALKSSFDLARLRPLSGP